MTNIMRDAFKKGVEVNKGWVVVFYIFIFVGLATGIVLWIKDFQTSVHGIELLPFRKVDWVDTYGGAMVLQLAGLFLMMWGRDSKKKWALYIGLSIMTADNITDSIFRISSPDGSFNWPLFPGAVLFSFFWYTVGSDLLVTVCLGLAIEYLEQAGYTVKSIFSSFGGFFDNAAEMLSGSEPK